MKHWSDRLPSYACSDAREWAQTQDSFVTAWAACRRGDWMVWLLGILIGRVQAVKRRRLVRCVCDCVEQARSCVNMPRTTAFDGCLRAARGWARGDGTTLAGVRVAANIATYYADSRTCPNATANAFAHIAVASVADIALNSRSEAGRLAVLASGAVVAVASAASRADASSSRDDYNLRNARSLLESATIVRKHYPKPPRLGRGCA